MNDILTKEQLDVLTEKVTAVTSGSPVYVFIVPTSKRLSLLQLQTAAGAILARWDAAGRPNNGAYRDTELMPVQKAER